MEISPEQYLDTSNGEAFGTPEQLQDAHLNQAAAGLNRRSQLQHELAGVTDQDLDEGRYDERTAQGEHLLQQFIAAASKATDPAERARYSRKAEEIAAGLVSGRQTQPQQRAADETSAYEELTSKGIDVQSVMEWAGLELAESSIDGFDELIKGQDQQLAYQTVQLLDHAKGRPDQYVHNDSDWEVPDDNYWLQFIDEFGEEPIHNLQTITLAIKNGITTPAKAFALYQADEPTKRAMLTLMQRGQLKMVI
jgi:hypothetical protein